MASDEVDAEAAFWGSIIAVIIGISLGIIGIGAVITGSMSSNYTALGGLFAIAGIIMGIGGIKSIINIITGRHKDS